MKTPYLISTLIIILSATMMHGQEIPNGGFENWYNTDYFEEPDLYSSSNSLSFMFGDTVNVSKSISSYSGTYAARLETMAFGADTVPAVIMIGQLSGTNLIGGIPYSQRPDSLAGYVKYNMLGGDELYIVCLFTRQGLPLGGIEATYSGTVNNYTRISMAVNWVIPFLNPDSLKVVISNSSAIVTGNPGSTVYLDQFQFIGASSPFPNGDFENWNMLSGEEPDDWTTLNYLTSTSSEPYATKSNDMHSGSWAIRLETTSSFFGEPIGFLTNGKFIGYEWVGGLAVDQNPSLVTGYYKYSPVGNDTALAYVSTYWYDITGDSNILVEEEVVKLPQASNYTYFEIPLEYNGTPLVDTANFAFAAGLFGGGMQPGSTLFLDDIGIEYYPVSVIETMGQGQFSVYPNPCRGNLNVMIGSGNTQSVVFSLFDATGRLVFNRRLDAINGEKYNLDLHDLKPGMYHYQVMGEEALSSGKVMILN